MEASDLLHVRERREETTCLFVRSNCVRELLLRIGVHCVFSMCIRFRMLLKPRCTPPKHGGLLDKHGVLIVLLIQGRIDAGVRLLASAVASQPPKRVVIAIDGPAACGKGTLSKHISRSFNLSHLVRHLTLNGLTCTPLKSRSCRP
jgi:hypothetical protein